MRTRLERFRAGFPVRRCLERLLLLAIPCALLSWVWDAVAGSPFAGNVASTQPNGEEITLFGRGDPFHADFETPEGFTVVFVPEEKAYHYAVPSIDGRDLISSGVVVGGDTTPPAGPDGSTGH